MKKYNQKYSLTHTIPLINREKSILAFQKRVLAQAEDRDMPLLERVNYVAIVSSNMDEFFEVRMANMQEQIHSGSTLIDDEPVIVWQQDINTIVSQLIDAQHSVFYEELLPLLAAENICLLDEMSWTEVQRTWLHNLFVNNVLPVLTPIALDIAHPFPHITNKSLNFIIDLEGTDAYGREIDIAILPIPENLAHIISVPSEDKAQTFVTIQSLMSAFIGDVFQGLTIKGHYQFRVTRNSHLFIDEEELTNLRQALKGELQQRSFAHAVRLEIDNQCPAPLVKILMREFDLTDYDLYRLERMFDLERLFAWLDLVKRPDLRFPPLIRSTPGRWKKRDNVFDLLKKGDVLLHHPFDRFSPVIDFLKEAAIDPAVQAIRMTVYRTGDESELMEQLVYAALQGKEVNVVVELMARFDEATNLQWASRLEEAGIKIVYGVFGYKTHAKMLLVIRKEEDSEGKPYLQRYIHIGTGNYHSGNARLYTDFSLLSANEDIAHDVSHIFLNLSSLGQAPNLRQIWQAPFNLIDQLLVSIEYEINEAKKGNKARIIAKMNALLEPVIIDALYRASQAGVIIDLIVRGACALKPGVMGLSENIHVRSIVGRFLEHSRIYYFYHGKDESVYLASADWMNRNFFRRIEICVPILDPKVKKQVIKEGLKMYLNDNYNTWILEGETGDYKNARAQENIFSVQQQLIEIRE